MTIRQQQLLLAFLDFYAGEPDGHYGPETRAAVIEFQRAYGLDPDGVVGRRTEKALRGAVAGTMEPVAIEKPTANGEQDFWQDIRYFTRAEFACPCGCGGFPAEPREKLARLADKVRAHFGAPAIVSSGVRCPKHNREVGGVANSRHLSGSAVDLTVRGHSAAEVTAYARSLPECAYTYAITSGGKETGYVHMDVA